MISSGTATAPPLARRLLLQVALLAPPFVVLAVVAAKPVLTDTPVGGNSLLLVLAAMLYLTACVGLARRPALLANVSLLAWAVVLVGLVAGGVYRHVRGRQAAAGVDAFQQQWDRYFQGEEWYREYGREFRASTQMQWYPYVMWRRRPFAGRYINVDSAGRRRTWNHEVPGGHPLQVFAFGGSTLWGNGARDDETIPSRLSRLLDTAGHEVRVTNYGELGFVSTQDVITLILELRAGHVPDVVVFYEGVNDVVASLQSHEAGMPQMTARMGGAMNRLYADYYRRVTGLAPDPEPVAGAAAVSGADLARSTVASYIGNVRVVEHLARAYGFRVFVFWQPVAFVGKPVSAEEAERIAPRRRPLGEFFAQVYEAMRSADRPTDLYDVSDAFGETPQTVYVDFCHLTEEGNRIVAARLADPILRALGP